MNKTNEGQAEMTEPTIITMFDQGTIKVDPVNTLLKTNYKWTLLAVVCPSAVGFHNGKFHNSSIDTLMLDLCINGGAPKIALYNGIYVLAYQFKGYKNTAWQLEDKLSKMPVFTRVELYMGHQF